eukprot:TRINITY_DN1452_c0_g1_i10.p1 TRINITY_DN1452_c0_g1~~TRINITY_DN1452_c0_g1_i10.p1  ORF type:complete len:331 (+),score=59.44 TRINITY_DN1452_c0_g1_i10:172-1164(+)
MMPSEERGRLQASAVASLDGRRAKFARDIRTTLDQTGLNHTVAGGVAGLVSKTATAPLSRITILMQVGLVRPTEFRARLGEIVRVDGIRGLWKGNMASCIHRVPYAAINFTTFDKVKRLLTNGQVANEDISMLTRLLAGGIAGGTALTCVYPLDLIRTRLSSQVRGIGVQYSGIVQGLGSVVQTEGVLALYKGLPATLIQVVPSMAMSYASYETCKFNLAAHKLFSDETGLPTVGATLVSAVVAGMISSTAMFPIDVIRRRLQLDGTGGERSRYRGLVHCAQSMIKREGFRALYGGLSFEIMRVMPTVVLLFGSYETVKSWLACSSDSEV